MTWLVMNGRAVITPLMGAAVVLTSTNALIEPAQAAQVEAQGQQSFTCQFDSGPRAGESASYAGVSGPPIAIGVPCSDGQGSTGVVIPDRSVQPLPTLPPPPLPSPVRPDMTFTCRFDNGPRAGQVQSYGGVTGIQSFPVGAPCTDGQGSSGVAISERPVPPPAPPPPPAVSFTCQFNSGPRAGQMQSYAGVTGIRSMPVGAQCTDGQGSTGVAIPDAAVPPAGVAELPPSRPVELSPPPPPLPREVGPSLPPPAAEPPPPPPPPPPAPRPRASSSPNRAVRVAEAIRSAPVGAPVAGLPGAVWADPKNTGFVTGYTLYGRYHRGAPPGFDPGAPVVATSSINPPASDIPSPPPVAVPPAVASRVPNAPAVVPLGGVPAGAVVGRAVEGLPGAVWADFNNDGVVDGYVDDGRYFPGAPPGYPFGTEPAPPPAPSSSPPVMAPPLARSGERG